jgi:hypothetical protein|tara:strand:- start:4316 stop:4504 length:189 start_codon:yes stop_codon:yes gene_type:complete
MDTHNMNSSMMTLMSFYGIKEVKSFNIKRESETGEHYISFKDQLDRDFSIKINIKHEGIIDE